MINVFSLSLPAALTRADSVFVGHRRFHYLPLTLYMPCPIRTSILTKVQTLSSDAFNS